MSFSNLRGPGPSPVSEVFPCGPDLMWFPRKLVDGSAMDPLLTPGPPTWTKQMFWGQKETFWNKEAGVGM